MKEIAKAASLQATKSVSNMVMGDGVQKTFHPSSEIVVDSEPSSHIVSQIMVTLAINHIIVSIIYVKYIDFNDHFSMNYLAKFLKNAKF